MKKIEQILFILLVNLCFIICLSNSMQAYQWEKTFGGESTENGYSLHQTSDEGYIITGVTSISGNYDIWLIKTDVNGNEEWNKTFGGSEDDRGKSVQQTADGGYIIAGYTILLDDSDRYGFLIKTDSEGNEEWNKTFGDESSDIGEDVQQTADGGYIITGYLYIPGEGGGICLIKTDTQGIEEWHQIYEYDPYSWGVGCSVQQKNDGGYIIVGDFIPVWTWDKVFLLSTDTEGNYLWHQFFLKPGYSSAYSDSVWVTNDNGFFITAYTDCIATEYDFWLIKTNSEGNMQWEKLIGGVGTEKANCGQQTADGGYIAVGLTTPYVGGVSDVYLVYFNPDIPGVPLSPTEIIFYTLILLLLAISPIFLKKKLSYNK